MPAIQAAREAARRAQCINNQRQVAFALLNFEQTKKSFPALRAPLSPSHYTAHIANIADLRPVDHTELTWVGFLLPFMEQNTAWTQINSGRIDPTLYDLVIPVMQCKSGGISSGDNRTSYVVNAGPQNSTQVGEIWCREYGNLERTRRDAKMYTIFFDHFSHIGHWRDIPANTTDYSAAGYWLDNARVSLDNISSMDGASMTILLSENEDAGRWIWYNANTGVDMPIASNNMGAENDDSFYAFQTSDCFIPEMEHIVGFCYPNVLSSIATGEIPTYEPAMVGGVPNSVASPLFINEGKSIYFSGVNVRGVPIDHIRKARPSSGHPGVVMAAFCDGSVRPLKEEMDKMLFVRLCRPGSGVILNPKDLD
jgi:prepilin-type processing-associated H-X9-DG protein